ncbi:ABC transporter ATP-binding protein [Ornithinimicrobium faecis]|uniref:ABC transporter ATP-binding protein n=1 Tax=Ornithinimicrobium faecis TaxID=2934158 RepID=UPI002117464F|nr:ABC transporter ATP-binding protein [Ornithinimicrobium sp. HY1745]
MTVTSTSEASAPGAGREPVLAVRGLSVTFRGRQHPIVGAADVDLSVFPGEMVALLGESGSGKSVTARAVMGLHAPETTTVAADVLRVGDADILSCTPRQLRSLRATRMSMVFQDALSALNPVLSIGDQIGELYRQHRGLSRARARANTIEMLELVGIPGAAERVNDYPHQFSGGMRQRLLIAMAIALEPELLIADEPTTALDVTIQAQILELLDRLRRELNMGVLLITHDLGVVSEVADRIAVMYAGRIVESATADQLFTQPAHPYTEALLRSVPQATDSGTELAVIPGSPPRPSALPQGCPFHPRCARAIDICTTTRPALVELFEGRRAACHRTEEVLRDAEL